MQQRSEGLVAAAQPTAVSQHLAYLCAFTRSGVRFAARLEPFPHYGAIAALAGR